MIVNKVEIKLTFLDCFCVFFYSGVANTLTIKAVYSLWNYFLIDYVQVVETILKSAEGGGA
jgi:hypothetical protein